jgi:hypothetical protein
MTTSIGYKKCANNRIVVLEPLGRNNEGRNDIVDANFAKMRCEYARVIKIYDMITKEEFESATSACEGHNKITYERGKIVCSDKYDSNLNDVCGSGIHYFKTEEPAYMYDFDQFDSKFDSKFTGILKAWYNNGLYMTTYNFKNGEKDGEHKIWHTNGKLSFIGNYINGKLNSHQEWTSDGKPIVNNKIYQYGTHVDTNMKSPLSTYGRNTMQISYTGWYPGYPVYQYPVYQYPVYYY